MEASVTGRAPEPASRMNGAPGPAPLDGPSGSSRGRQARRLTRRTVRVLAVVVAAEALASAGGLAAHRWDRPAGTAAAVRAGLSPIASAVYSGGSSSAAARPSARAGSAPPPSVTAPAAHPAPVSCQTDLSLVAAPDTGYSFLCSQGGAPVTWPTGRISIHESGLTAVQSAAFATAVAQWSRAARFQVTYVSSASAAQVTVTDAPLGTGAPGYVEDGYTTVSYQCTPRCVYKSARVQLSSTAALVESDWVSTILHELGHVAGLNHVSKGGEVMYPYLVAASPVTYQAGDLAGLAVLADQRDG